MASFNGFPVPESILRLGDGKNSSDSLCSATFPILLHIMYQIPASKIIFKHENYLNSVKIISNTLQVFLIMLTYKNIEFNTKWVKI